ncbi:MAG: GNAT family N-acetyltransferase [Planctomycetota bacterium]
MPTHAAITIRRAEPTDAQALHNVFSQPLAQAHTLQMPLPLVTEWEERLTNRPAGLYSFVAELDGVVVGSASLNHEQRPRRQHIGGIGMGVHDDHHGRGVGTALMDAIVNHADNWLDLKRLELTVFVDNPAAIALYRKFGFEDEGVQRAHGFRAGEYVDALMMARIRGL